MPEATAAIRQTEGEVLNEQQAAAFLGIKPRTLREWELRRGLPHFQPTRKIKRYRASDLMSWLERYRVQTISHGAR